MATPTGAISLKGRYAQPSHYTFKIESFSLLSKASIVKFCSDDFEAGGYKWKLWIYPTGDNSITGKDHVSLYLELLETSSFPTGWEVYVISNLFIFNHLQNKYYSNKDVKEMYYHSMNTLSGISKFIDLNTFSNSENGYLFNDTCVFGVEVFVVSNTIKEGRLSMMQDHSTYFHTWKVTKFSSLVNQYYVSESFGRYKWNICLYPNGNLEGNGNSVSIYLGVSRSCFPPNSNLFVKYILRVKDQMKGNLFVKHILCSKKDQMKGKHIELKGDYLYCLSDNFYIGSSKFLSLARLKDQKQGYLVDDTLTIEAEATLLGIVFTKS